MDIAIKQGGRRPRLEYPPVQIYYFSGPAFSEGVETRIMDGVKVRIYNAEKTVADAFKYRNRIGLDVALEALKAWRRRPEIQFEKLLGYARICRVEKTIRPYLEAIA